MARDWSNTHATRESILERMAKYGENIAEVPYASSMEKRDSGYVWVVDIHVKVKGHVEFDISGEAPTLAEALRKVYLGLNNEGYIREYSARNRSVFGLASI